MKWILMVLAVLVVAASAGYVGFLLGRESAPPGEKAKEEEEKAATAKVKVAPARLAGIGKPIVGYGVVRAAPEAVHVFSVPYESRVRRFQVTPGQAVAAAAVLLEVDPSPGTLLQVEQAKGNVASATRKVAQAKHAFALDLREARSTRDSTAKLFAQTKRRMEMKLATSQELVQAQQEMDLALMKLESLEKLDTTAEILQAQQDLQLAQLQLASLEKLGIGAPTVRTETAGVVNNLMAQEGQIVPAGGPLVELAEEKRTEVRLSVNPPDAADLKPGQAMTVALVNDTDAKPVEGRVRLITQRVNPASRLVEVFVALPPDTRWLLESYVRGRASVNEKQALVVPRAAVLPEEEKHILFTLKDGKAVEHEVEIGLENDEVVEILGGGIKAGDAVVIQGNYELKPGMAVEIEKPGEEKEKSAPAAGKEKEKGKEKGEDKEKAPKAEKKAPAAATEKAP